MFAKMFSDNNMKLRHLHVSQTFHTSTVSFYLIMHIKYPALFKIIYFLSLSSESKELCNKYKQSKEMDKSYTTGKTCLKTCYYKKIKYMIRHNSICL